MKTDYKKRQATARALAAAAWIALALYTRPWGCSSAALDPEPLDAGDPTASAASRDGDIGDAGDGAAEEGKDALEGETSAGGLEHILFLGFDRSGRLPGRTDAILIARVDHEANRIGVVSVPRDLWVEIPGVEPGRINKVFRVGNMLGGPGGGNTLMKAVIAAELGITIDHTVAVDFKGFENVVDTLGGIRVHVDCPIEDNFVSSQSETGYENLKVGEGDHLMNGHTALLFSRSRHGRGDMDRSRRQQAVLRGLRDKGARLEVVPKIPVLWNRLKNHVATDLGMDGIASLISTAISTGQGDFHGMILTDPVVYQWRSPDGKSVLKLNRPAFNKAMASIYESPLPGIQPSNMCRPADVALNWKELGKKKRQQNDMPEAGELEQEGVEDEITTTP